MAKTASPQYYVGLDVGGSSMKAGVVDSQGNPLSSGISVPTEAHRGQDYGLDQMARAIDEAVEVAHVTLQDIAGIGVATPGTMDIPNGIILDPPNLKPWQNVPVRQYIADRFGIPTAFQNDANAAALGEFWVGAGKDVHSMVLFTLGTGVGGGIILGDMVLEGEHSHGAEVGHIRIELDKARRCGCGRLGCLEAYASATAVVNRTLEYLETYGKLTVLRDLEKKNGSLTARDIFDAALAGDALAQQIVEETAFYLAVGATNLMHVIDPDMVAFAGGMTAAGDSFLRRIQAHVKDLAFPVPAERTIICYAKLGSDAGYIGAAACGKLLVKKSLAP